MRTIIGWLLGLSAAACGSGGNDGEARSDAGPHDDASSEPHQDAGAGLGGSACDYYCSGMHCNLRCEDDVIYRCPPSGTWQLEADCAVKGQRCAEVIDQAGMAIDLVCE